MSPRVAYWVGSFEPEIEAVAAEVACLRRAFPGSVAWGVSARDGWRLSWRSGFGFPPWAHLGFRAATWLLQHAFDVNHVFGGLNDWFHLTAVHKRPVVLTMALDGLPADPRLLEKVDSFVVEWPGGAETLQRLGVPASAIQLILPPVDLRRFHPAAEPAAPFTVLFASSPDRADWLLARGVHLLLDAAELLPEVRFRLVWRPWGNSLAAVRAMIRQRDLPNVEVAVGRFRNMEAFYQSAHVTVFPFTSAECCKPAPNSLLESLACGRPVVVTDMVGLAQVVCDAGAGVSCQPERQSLAAGIEAIREDWGAFSRRARAFAELSCEAGHVLQAYSQAYEKLL